MILECKKLLKGGGGLVFVKKHKKLEKGNFVTKTNNIQNEQRN